jgi:hypothetical protein
MNLDLYYIVIALLWGVWVGGLVVGFAIGAATTRHYYRRAMRQMMESIFGPFPHMRKYRGK